MKFDLVKTYPKITLYRIIAVASNFIITAILIRELESEVYGIYALLISLINWVYFFDLGINKGLKNQATKFYENNNFDKIESILNTSLGASSALVLVLIIPLFSIIDVKEIILKKDNVNIELISNSIYIFFTIISIKFISNSINQVSLSLHQSEKVALSTSLLSLMVLISIFCCLAVGIKINLLIILIIELLGTLFSSGVLLIFLLKKFNLKILIFKRFDIQLLISVLKDSFFLFGIQVGSLLLVAIDRLLILNYTTDSINIAQYDIAYKIFALVLFPFTIISKPLWASFAAAINNKDTKWIKNGIRNLYFYLMLSGFFLIVLYFAFDWIKLYWVGEDLQISASTKTYLCLFFVVFLASSINHDVLMGFGKFKSYLAFIGICCAVKYSFIFFSKINTETGTQAVIQSSLFAYLILASLGATKIFKVVRDQRPVQ